MAVRKTTIQAKVAKALEQLSKNRVEAAKTTLEGLGAKLDGKDAKPRKPSKYALFVKSKFAATKKQYPELDAPAIMKKIAEEYNATNTVPEMSPLPPSTVVDAERGDVPSQETVYVSRHLDDVKADETMRATNLAIRALNPGLTHTIGSYEKAAPHANPDGLNEVYSQLLGREVPVENFVHNNMVPFGNVRQPKNNDGFKDKLEIFTGGFDLRPIGYKAEIKPQFAPTPDGVITSGGRAYAGERRDSRLDSIQPSRIRNNELPDALLPIRVGRPGIAGGKTGDVYYDMRDKELPPTVNQLRPGNRPKLSYEGRVVPGLGTAPLGQEAPQPHVNLDQHRMPIYRTQTSADDFFRGPGAVTAPKQTPEIVQVGRMNRGSQDTQHVGPSGGITTRMPAVGAAGSFLVYGNNRDTTTVCMRPGAGAVANAVKALIAPIADALRTTRKEQDVDAPREFGNPGGQGTCVGLKLTVYDANDVARTTLKEAFLSEAPTMNFAPAATFKQTVYDPSDVARTTVKETTTAEAPRLNLAPTATFKRTVYDPSDVARTTLKETTTAESPQLNLAPTATFKQTVYDPSDVARTTLKEAFLSEAPTMNPAPTATFKQVVYFDDAARTTTAETTLAEAPVLNLLGGAHRAVVYDPDDVARVTRKQMTVGLGGGPAGGNVSPRERWTAGAYTTTTYEAGVTQRQVSADAAGTQYGAPGGENAVHDGGAYLLPSDDGARPTNRETTSVNYYGGSQDAGPSAPTDGAMASAP
ncbi:hypothetical protein CEUSTIGMA_g11913.t1 [Chlamydomonas eustigma]|uniref:Uncharacterized protein n=1 Tax=Chlamydomonas eustigma TaxID=1157962 RepID=A0A250XNB8_9CHLO|nr:hypothetical protein CEUSTIGMA_g11913.t1 [Chlamydomonas eustigma]|eukprot:GAX84493.1 hypothetical protein CEUSTIGMA_g11913.t1 [Chlamydomonas eustigma]